MGYDYHTIKNQGNKRYNNLIKHKNIRKIYINDCNNITLKNDKYVDNSRERANISKVCNEGKYVKIGRQCATGIYPKKWVGSPNAKIRKQFNQDMNKLIKLNKFEKSIDDSYIQPYVVTHKTQPDWFDCSRHSPKLIHFKF